MNYNEFEYNSISYIGDMQSDIVPNTEGLNCVVSAMHKIISFNKL